MSRSAILKISFSISILCLITGPFCKILHYPLSLEIVVIALIAALIFIVTALPEVWTSGHIHISEKIMWTTGFLVMLALTGILYLTVGRKRVLTPDRLTTNFKF